MQSFIMNSHEVFIHIHQGCFAGTGAIVRLPQCQWSKPDRYGKISQCITTTKHSKAKPLCIFPGIYCNAPSTEISALPCINLKCYEFLQIRHTTTTRRHRWFYVIKWSKSVQCADAGKYLAIQNSKQLPTGVFTHLPLVPHICVGELGQHWSR